MIKVEESRRIQKNMKNEETQISRKSCMKKCNSFTMFSKQYVCKVCDIMSYEYWETEKGIFCDEHITNNETKSNIIDGYSFDEIEDYTIIDNMMNTMTGRN
jgi:hypothetical protein